MTAVETLITDNLDIWTSAIKTKSASGRGSSKKLELYGIKKLRELILELAVRGLLVPQDPNDEPAIELLKKIKTEKERLVKEGKIKKQKPLPPITDEEKPFELPEGWEWVSLKEVCILENGDRSKNYPNKSLLVDSGVPFVNAGHLQLGLIDENQMTFITEERFELLKAGKFTIGDILYCLRGSLGKSAIVEKIERGAIASSLVIVRLFTNLDRYYFHNYFDSPLSYGMIKQYDNGTAQPNLSAADLGKFLIPLPPEAEQTRIVAKVNDLMTLCDQLEQQQESSISAHETLVKTLLDALVGASERDECEQAWSMLSEHFHTLFTTENSIDQLKQTILQLAVMGKLVRQDPDDEPASELLKKIKKEKERLVKEGKIKKQKPLPPITDEEKPFELPEGWEWERISNLSTVGTGSTPSRDKPSYYTPAEYSWVTSGETSQDFVYDTKEKVSQKALQETNISLYPVGTLIVAMYGQGKTRGQITELMIEAGTNQACAAIQLVNSSEYHRKYIKLFFKKAYDELRSNAAGGAQPNLNVKKISMTVLPLPPFLEQQRIVAKVNNIMSLCDQLQLGIDAKKNTQLYLADAISERRVR